MRSGMVVLRLLTLTAIGLTSYGCDWRALQADRNRNLQAQHTSALIKGHEAFETLMLDTDTGIVWFEYRVPSTLDPTQAATTVANQIREHEPCFKVEEASLHGARLRCSAPSPGISFREYRIAVQPAQRKVLVMYAPIDEEAEHIGYPIAVQDFKKQVARGSN